MTKLRPVPTNWWSRLPKKTRRRVELLIGNDAREQLTEALADGSDGCTWAPDVVLPACWLHDGLLQLGMTWEADRQFYCAIVDMGRNDETIWRLVYWEPLAFVFYSGVTIGQVWRKVWPKIWRRS